MLGSETSKVLAHSRIPVLVLPMKARPRGRSPGGRTPRLAILVPVDGSAPAGRAAREAAALAAKLGAQLIGLHVITPFEALPRRGLHEPPTVEGFEKHARRMAERFLSAVGKAASARRVPYRCHVAKNVSPARGIIAAARTHRCRYIVMGSHGRRGLSRLLLGSVTQQVLARSSVPVLVRG